jgi:hypothetical protein
MALHNTKNLFRLRKRSRPQRRFVLNIDLMILPFLIVMFFLASLVYTNPWELDLCRFISKLIASQDRGDVTNAYTAGLQKELKMTATELSSCLSLFYVSYLVFELPACLFLKKVTASL